MADASIEKRFKERSVDSASTFRSGRRSAARSTLAMPSCFGHELLFALRSKAGLKSPRHTSTQQPPPALILGECVIAKPLTDASRQGSMIPRSGRLTRNGRPVEVGPSQLRSGCRPQRSPQRSRRDLVSALVFTRPRSTTLRLTAADYKHIVAIPANLWL